MSIYESNSKVIFWQLFAESYFLISKRELSCMLAKFANCSDQYNKGLNNIQYFFQVPSVGNRS